MKSFLIKTFCFLLISAGGILSVFMLADGTTDPYYKRLTTPKQHSLILGTSRAANALNPAVFDDILQTTPNNRFFNYSFDVFISSYSPAYYKSIQRKLDKNTSDGTFILSVTPWNLSNRPGESDDELTFREDNQFLAGMPFVNMKPNVHYLVKYYQDSYLKILQNRRNPPIPYLHSNGWLEINLYDRDRDFEEQMNIQIQSYEELLYKSTLSNVRLKYFEKTIRFLSEYGTVYLVRLPIHENMFKLEDIYSPEFDTLMSQIANDTGAQYLSFKDHENPFLFYDHEHVESRSAADVSAYVAEWIKSIK